MLYTGPKCRLCRNSGVKLFLKGEKCESTKCPVVRRQSTPGLHSKRRPKVSDFSYHLKEKQKLKRIYLLSEAQLRKYFDQSRKRLGNTGEILLSLLERRLDNVLVRSGLASSHAQARQLIRHKHFRVNARIVDIPSFVLRVGDKVGFESGRHLIEVTLPVWLNFKTKENLLEMVGMPKREDVKEELNEQLVVEYYSR